MNWLEIGVPEKVAMMQTAWDRRHKIKRMRECGLSTQQIADRIGISVTRVGGLIAKANCDRGHLSPVELWMNQSGEIHEFQQRLLGKYWDSTEYRWKTNHKWTAWHA